MTEPRSQFDAAAFEGHVREVADAVALAGDLLRSLALLGTRWDTLDGAIAAYLGATSRPAATPTTASGAPPAPVPSASSPAPSSVAAGTQIPAAVSPPPASVAAGEAPATRPPAQPPVTVTAVREDAPLDLVRVHTALAETPGVTSVALVNYTRGRAVLHVVGDHPIALQTLTDRLRTAFPEGVQAEQAGADTLAVTIGQRSAPA